MLRAVGLSVTCVVLSVLLQFEVIGWLWRFNAKPGASMRDVVRALGPGLRFQSHA